MYCLRKSLLLLVCLAAGGIPAVADDFNHEHGQLTAILAQHVVVSGASSVVDYAALRAEPAALDAYLAQLSAVDHRQFHQWRRRQQMAFLINAYNAFTLQLIRDNEPVASIKDLGSLFRSPWKIAFFDLFGEKFTLDRIEHDTLRPDYDEPRVHFVLNCASIGCPMLADHAYTATALDRQLEQQTMLFLQDTRRNRVDAKDRVLVLSPLFDWYAGDFVGASGSVAAFVAPYMAPHIGTGLHDYTIRYSDYDWSLNSR